MFLPNINGTQAAKKPKMPFLSLVTLTFKLVRPRGQIRLPREFGTNLFSGSRDISYTNKHVLSSSWDGRLFGHSRHGLQKSGRPLCPFEGELGPHLTQCGQGRGLLPYQVASWSIQPFGHNRHGSKIGGLLCPFFGGGAVSPSITMCPWQRPTSVSSGIWIHPALWPEYIGQKVGGCSSLLEART